MSQLFYLKECSSTNDEISKFLLYGNSDFIGLHTFNQTKGRGQYGNVWTPTAGKNLAYTLAVNTQNILCSDFIFNYYTAILVRDFLANLADNDVKIKWPNDIILKGKKIVGILIEKKKINQNNYFIIGTGINILQEKFDEISNAGSLLTQTGREFKLEDLSLSFHEFLSEKLKIFLLTRKSWTVLIQIYSVKMKSQSLKLEKGDKMASFAMQMKKENSGLNWKMTACVLSTTKK